MALSRVCELRLAVAVATRAIDELERRQAEVEQLLSEAPWGDAPDTEEDEAVLKSERKIIVAKLASRRDELVVATTSLAEAEREELAAVINCIQDRLRELQRKHIQRSACDQHNVAES